MTNKATPPVSYPTHPSEELVEQRFAPPKDGTLPFHGDIRGRCAGSEKKP